ncbi:MAG TPA: hypothetical protein VGP33_03270 [Chloroflexota bacterium]|nr:hypothetical protein [Chloroflexota bacterium]
MPEPSRSDETTLFCCHLVYALAPAGMSRKDADNLFNDYVAEVERGVVVHHDHFIDCAGAFAVFDIKDNAQKAMLAKPGPLAGWQIAFHPLVFAPDGAGFFMQADSTLRHFRGTRLDQGPVAEKGSHAYTLVPGGGYY